MGLQHGVCQLHPVLNSQAYQITLASGMGLMTEIFRIRLREFRTPALDREPGIRPAHALNFRTNPEMFDPVQSVYLRDRYLRPGKLTNA